MVLAVSLMGSVVLYALLASLLKIDLGVPKEPRETIYSILIAVIIVVMIVILSVRKTIYFSPRIVKEDFTLTQVLRKWRVIDTILLAMAESIPLIGLLLTWMGIPWERTWFIFLVSILLIIILMPVGIKVRSKLNYIRKYNKRI